MPRERHRYAPTATAPPIVAHSAIVSPVTYAKAHSPVQNSHYIEAHRSQQHPVTKPPASSALTAQPPTHFHLAPRATTQKDTPVTGTPATIAATTHPFPAHHHQITRPPQKTSLNSISPPFSNNTCTIVQEVTTNNPSETFVQPIVADLHGNNFPRPPPHIHYSNGIAHYLSHTTPSVASCSHLLREYISASPGDNQQYNKHH